MITVRDLWKLYETVCKRHRSYKDDLSRSKTLIRLLGERDAASLSVIDVDGYREARFNETTVRGGPPSPATVDREVELLKRMLGYAVQGRRLPSNPLADVSMLAVNNTREVIVSEQDFQKLLTFMPKKFHPILVAAFDTGCRIGELMNLRWDAVDWGHQCFRLSGKSTKGQYARVVHWTDRLAAMVNTQDYTSEFVFDSRNLRRAFSRARKLSGMSIVIHDLRRAYAIRARRAGVPESVVMRVGGWRSNAVFSRYNIIDENDLQQAAKVLSLASNS